MNYHTIDASQLNPRRAYKLFVWRSKQYAVRLGVVPQEARRKRRGEVAKIRELRRKLQREYCPELRSYIAELLESRRVARENWREGGRVHLQLPPNVSRKKRIKHSRRLIAKYNKHRELNRRSRTASRGPAVKK